MKWLITGFYLLGWTMSMLSQPPDYREEGVFSSATAFMTGIPDMTWSACCQDWYVSPEDEYLRVELQPGRKEWKRPVVVCVEGECFVHDPELDEPEVAFYARLIAVGPIGLYRIKRTFVEDIPIKAYNPVNGRPFVQGKVQRPRDWESLYMWDTATGTRRLLDRFSFQDWTGYEAPESGKEADLIRGIRAYNQMHGYEKDPTND